MMLIETDSRQSADTGSARHSLRFASFAQPSGLVSECTVSDHNQFSKPTMEAEMSSGEGPRPMLLARSLAAPLPVPTIETFLCEHDEDLILPHYVDQTIAIEGSIHHFQNCTLPYSYRETAAIF
jgi:hypothetical protein